MGDYQLYIGEKKNWSGKEMPNVVHVLPLTRKKNILIENILVNPEKYLMHTVQRHVMIPQK